MYTHVENAQQAGLDPEKPPAKWSETWRPGRRRPSGRRGHRRAPGLVPLHGQRRASASGWCPTGSSAGSCSTPTATKFTLFNDRAVEALTWLKKIVDNQGGWQAIDAFRNSFSDPERRTPSSWEGAPPSCTPPSPSAVSSSSIKAPTMKFTVSSYPLPDRGGTVANYGGLPRPPHRQGQQEPGRDLAVHRARHQQREQHQVRRALRPRADPGVVDHLAGLHPGRQGARRCRRRR